MASLSFIAPVLLLVLYGLKFIKCVVVLTEERGKVAEDEGEIDVEEVDQLVGVTNAWEKMQRQITFL